jgi:hypothetical protein
MFKNVTIQKLIIFMHVLVLKCGITGRTSSKNSFHAHFWHFSMRKPDKAAGPDKGTTGVPCSKRN